MDSTEIESVTILSRQEGYDYVFDPPLEGKYECAICLLALRSPIQTTCGHRFCKECIYNCISESSRRCPVDNNPLTEADLFPDSCAEREILQLTVRCPNHTLGCSYNINLQYIDNHTQACPYQPVMCPNECSATVLQKELDEHLTSKCVLRVKKCDLCDEPVTFNQEQLHLLTCAQVRVVCEMCGIMLARGNMQHHLTDNCPQVVVACSFAEHGCHHKMTRSDLEEHMAQSTQFHLHMVSSAFKKINAFVSDLSRTVGIIQSPHGNFSRQPSLRSQISATSPIPEHHTSPSNPDHTLEKSLCGGGDKPPVFPQLGGERNSAEAAAADVNKFQLHLGQFATGENSKGSNKPSSSTPALSHQNIILRDLCEKSVDLSQSLLEESIRLGNLEKQLEEIEAAMEAQALERSGRICNGVFVWRIQNFLEELQENFGKVWYSPSFYSSQFGYKFCLRVNTTMRDGKRYVSLFIHVRLGENDDILDWPFKGNITLSILDVNSVTRPKKHITETALTQTKPGGQAFIQPQTQRNPKGFGYTEFVSMNRVVDEKEACYLKDGTLTVKAVVRPAEVLPSNIECICHYQKSVV
ncbi:hypothetical protein Pcinc_004378 [Petrolisthes cinctipes]|uniref:RING-type E3 ubiquitin transferase n=1 Tax=Petrolisthes cinctipes TaxID=88211 RepID=A0AAE1GEL4_PETCI|nr:hypothetical protein Pcinc_004378 [Petrolisthes cinctipes]